VVRGAEEAGRDQNRLMRGKSEDVGGTILIKCTWDHGA
jgi:hypothetical protein